MAGRLTEKLLAAGWIRVEAGALCGQPGPTTGECPRSARWATWEHGRPVCAQHAAGRLSPNGTYVGPVHGG